MPAIWKADFLLGDEGPVTRCEYTGEARAGYLDTFWGRDIIEGFANAPTEGTGDTLNVFCDWFEHTSSLLQVGDLGNYEKIAVLLIGSERLFWTPATHRGQWDCLT